MSVANLSAKNPPVHELQLVWQLCQWAHLRTRAQHPNIFVDSYHEGCGALNLSAQRMPTLNELNLRVQPTGWSLVGVPGYLPPWEFFELLARRQLPVAQHVRSLENVYHSPVPDYIHDIFGHLPWLFDDSISEFSEAIGNMARDIAPSQLDIELSAAIMAVADVALSNNFLLMEKYQRRLEFAYEAMAKRPTKLHFLGRMYLWTIEFGVMLNGKIIGAGLLSSQNEIARIAAGSVSIQPFGSNALSLDINFSGQQSVLFAIPSLARLPDILDICRARCDHV